MKYAHRILLGLVIAARFVFGFADSTWTGYVTDTHCGTHCQRTSDMKPDLQCIRTCVRKGSKYGLWCGNQVYVVEPQKAVAQYAAQNIEIHGTMRNGTIYISSITPLESFAARP